MATTRHRRRTLGTMDAAIARSLGITQRTTTRRIAQPMGEPNARTGSQADPRAAKHCWR
ncbi:hypothetical protein [Kitasatospora phosalacinea]|uniref:hypothetical protein n=1 Tax=Kitasatospora phosalacinea TaxID=2065 RepID=UPI000B1F7BB8|nr:hypothetical protein [Kitasatospora phosalacinea]